MKKGEKSLTLVLILFAILNWSGAQGADAPRDRVKETFDAVDAVLRPAVPKPSEGASPPHRTDDVSITSPPPIGPSAPGQEDRQSGKPLDMLGRPDERGVQIKPILIRRLMKGRPVALVIGINAYRHLERLHNAAGDARSVAETLKELYGFEIRLLLNNEATREGIMRSLNELRRTLTENDSLLIYYSGHGHYDRESDTSYWLPSDAESDDNTRWLETRSLTDQFKLISARQVLVVADSCFAGAITRSAPTDLAQGASRDAYLAKLLEKTTRVLIASGGNEPVVDAGASEHSIFADAFLRALRAPFSSVFTAEELMIRHLREEVAGRADQIPEYKVIRNSGHDGGDFIFVKRK